MSISQNFVNLRPSLLLDFANTEQLDPRITFSRPTTASYYDANTTALAEQNLLTYSQAIGGTNWINNTTLTTNTTTAPDGTTTASTLTVSAAGARYTNQSVASSVVSTYSVYVLAGTLSYIQLFFSGSDGTSYANFNVSTGTLGNSSGNATITAVSGGWFRCTLTSNGSAITGISNNIVDNGTATRAASTTLTSGSLYLWGAQLEQRSTVTAYNVTTTAITNYIPVLLTAPTNQARFDHDPVARTSLGLLIEQQSTNLVTYSGALDNAVWGQVNCTVNANTKIAPDGTLTATKIVENTTASVAHYLQEGITVTTATSYTTTVYMKAGERTWGYILENSGVSAQAYFNLSTGVVGTVSGTGSPSATITSVGNGWYRCSMTFTSSGTSAGVRFGPASADNTKTYTGDGYSGVFTWGAQIEALAFPTSYIPTQASQVTRSQDLASMTGTNFSSWYNNQQGTLYTEAWSPNSNGSTNWGISVSLDDGVTGNNNQYMIRSGSYIYASSSGSSAAFGTPGQSLYKATLAYQASSYASTINGTLTTSSTITSVSNTIKQLSIGSQYVSQQPLNGWIKKIAYYPIRVTNAQLQSLTGS